MVQRCSGWSGAGRMGVWVGALAVLGVGRSALADAAESAGGQPLLLGQVPATAPVERTASQGHTNQLNQLFQFEATPDICAKGEGYASAQFRYTDYGDQDFNQYRFQIQGQYGITDQVAVGAFIPILHSEDTYFDQNFDGIGDVGIYGQYKFDRLIDPHVVSLTGQLDVILPTGDDARELDRGEFGVRPLALAYKDFGKQGPGVLGLYGLFGFTITSDADVRVGVAVTYDLSGLVLGLELNDVSGGPVGVAETTLTPGVVYRGLRDWEFALAVPIGIGEGVDAGVTAKVTYAVER